ncbi:hypothetical protein APHAL10511_004343 [Amanita phalloides]|nr:hypothetical protein APHAL10511_004343 [Amanita phalloides]
MSHSLSARRGSLSAPDPYGAHAHLRRPSTSVLTIVRVQELSSQHKRFARRSGQLSSSPEQRLSFALSSFSPTSAQPPSPSSSPGSSPRIRPALHGLAAKTRLSAEQIVDIARNAKSSPGSSPQSPVLSPTQVTFTPLPDDIYLPFIYRAQEVTQLISSPPTSKLFSLLKQAFSSSSNDDRAESELDPALWSYSQLIHHLTNIDRDVCSDADWVYAARKCIMSHSELIWERVKSALGVPPELDAEDLLSATFGPDDSAIEDSPLVARVDHFPSHRRVTQEETSIEVFDADDSISTDVELDAEHLTFEPMLSNSGSNPTPLSLPSSLTGHAGLGDIAEGAEEEGEQEGTDQGNKPQEDDELIEPSKIQGLRISTSYMSSNESLISSPVVCARDEVSTSATPPSESTVKGTGLSRASSTGRSYRRTRFLSMSAVDRKEWDPLFPSSFARLAVGPTLIAK